MVNIVCLCLFVRNLLVLIIALYLYSCCDNNDRYLSEEQKACFPYEIGNSLVFNRGSKDSLILTVVSRQIRFEELNRSITCQDEIEVLEITAENDSIMFTIEQTATAGLESNQSSLFISRSYKLFDSIRVIPNSEEQDRRFSQAYGYEFSFGKDDFDLNYKRVTVNQNIGHGLLSVDKNLGVSELSYTYLDYSNQEQIPVLINEVVYILP